MESILSSSGGEPWHDPCQSSTEWKQLKFMTHRVMKHTIVSTNN